MTEPGGTAPLTSQTPPATSEEAARLVVDPAVPLLLRDVDSQIIEALRREDRSYVLKLGQLMESLIKDTQRHRIALLTSTDDQCSLVHRCCAYYQLKSDVDPLTEIIYVESTPESCIAYSMSKLSELVPVETNQPPQTHLLSSTSVPSDSESHVELDTGTGSLESYGERAHHGHKTSSKVPETTADYKRPVAKFQDDSSSKDSETFFRNQLKGFKHLYRLDESWPPDDLVFLLSDIAKDFTDLASLAVRYLRDPFIGDPQFQLDRLLNILERAPIDDNVQELPRICDRLYLDILSRIPLDIYDNNVKLILIPQVLSRNSPSLALTCDALGIAQNKAYEGLRYLHPVLSIPSPQDINDQSITAYDDSFVAFLTDPTRSHRYVIARDSKGKQSGPSSHTIRALESSSEAASHLSIDDATVLESLAWDFEDEQISDVSVLPHSVDYQTDRPDTSMYSMSALVPIDYRTDDKSKAQQTPQTTSARTSSMVATTVTQGHSILGLPSRSSNFIQIDSKRLKLSEPGIHTGIRERIPDDRAHSPERRRAGGSNESRSPDSLLPLDFSTQLRRYISDPSRKDISSFSRKRPAYPTPEEEEELEEEQSDAPHTDQEEIERRRRKNTITARKSRMKKIEQKIALEKATERLTTEKEIWRTRALTLRSLLTSHGIPCPDFDDFITDKVSEPATVDRQTTTEVQQSRIKSLNPSQSEPCEDGKVREDLPPPPRGSAADCAPPPTNVIPIRRPKRGPLSLSHFDHLHDKYYQAGRTLKYSGDARFWSTYPPTHKEYRPLADPPPVNTLYHKYGGLIARMELLDALVCFTYSIWTRDYCRKTCTKETWTTITAFLSWCKSKWLARENAIDEAEKTFIGLIYMIESFIGGRKMFYTMRQELDRGMDRITEQAKAKVEAAIQEVEQNAANPGPLASKSQGTPPMLPSPTSTAPTKSANSTPTNRDGSTPNTAARPPVPSQNPPPQQSRQQGPPRPNPAFFPLLPRRVRESPAPPSSYLEAASKVTESIDASMICNLKDLTATYRSTASSMSGAQKTLNLATLARHFPTTFSRMVNSTLSPSEEHEPDFEDEEGELFWPGQLVTGEGLGWVCLMGKAMILEFGKAYGYRGLQGAIPKPDDAPKPSYHSQRPPHPQAISHSSSASGSR